MLYGEQAAFKKQTSGKKTCRCCRQVTHQHPAAVGIECDPPRHTPGWHTYAHTTNMLNCKTMLMHAYTSCGWGWCWSPNICKQATGCNYDESATSASCHWTTICAAQAYLSKLKLTLSSGHTICTVESQDAPHTYNTAGVRQLTQDCTVHTCCRDGLPRPDPPNGLSVLTLILLPTGLNTVHWCSECSCSGVGWDIPQESYAVGTRDHFVHSQILVVTVYLSCPFMSGALPFSMIKGTSSS